MNVRKFEGKTPQLAQDVYIDETAVVIGDVEIGRDSAIWPTAVVRADVNKITIGERSNIQDGTICHVNHKHKDNPEGDPLVIGDDVTIGHRVVLHGCTIEDECLIGINTVVMDKVLIQKNVLVGANSLVPQGKALASGYLYMGSPVKQIRPLTDDEMAYFKYSADHYVALKNKHMKSEEDNVTK